MSELVKKRAELAEKQKRLATVFDEAGPEMDFARVKSLGENLDTAAKVSAVRQMNRELEELGQKIDELAELERIQKSAKGFNDFRQPEPEEKRAGAPEHKTLGRLVVESESYKNRKQGDIVTVLDIDLKAVMSTGGGFAPEVLRNGQMVDFATRPIQILDIIPQLPTGQSAVQYMEETTYTNNAAEAAESAEGALVTWPESALAFTERTSPVRKIATFIPVTDEQLEDVAFVESYVNNRLGFMLRQRLDGQVLVGNGTAPNLRGILNVAGIQTQAKGADPVPDAAYKAMVKVRVAGRATPNAFILHPNDWQDIRLLKTADGIYIWGSPSEAAPARLWGLNVVESDAITENTGLVGDFANFCYLAVRRDVDVRVGYKGNDFVQGVNTIRADMRAAFVVVRPAAFATITGI